MTRYIIIGAGAIGGGIGGRLAEVGTPTVLVARGDHLAALQQRGMRLRSPDADVTVKVTAVGGPEELELRDDDVLVVATKTHQAPAALAQWADAPVRGDDGSIRSAGERLPILMALNGVASEEMALRYFARVFGVCVWMPAVHLEPGEVIIRGVPISGLFHIGRVPATLADDRDRELLGRVRSDWTAANFAVTLPEDVMPWKYRKLISNIANAFQALVGGNGDLDRIVDAADVEARQILDAAGIPYTDDADEKQARAQSFTIQPVPGEPAELGGSTWQSLTRGTGNVESDYLNGEIALLAHRLGLQAPINATVASLARSAAARGQRPGSISAADLAETLGLCSPQ
jgi:2-dehydropantoate 2-reductase